MPEVDSILTEDLIRLGIRWKLQLNSQLTGVAASCTVFKTQDETRSKAKMCRFLVTRFDSDRILIRGVFFNEENRKELLTKKTTKMTGQ